MAPLDAPCLDEPPRDAALEQLHDGRCSSLTLAPGSGDDAELFAAIGAAARNRTLTSLSLGASPLGDAAFATLIDALGSSDLASLCLGSSALTDVGAGALADALARDTLPKLVRLSLGVNSFTEAAARALSPHLTSLHHLSLGVNGLGDGGAAVISRGLARGCTLRTLDLGLNEFGGAPHALAGALPAALSACALLEELHLGGAAAGASATPLAAALAGGVRWSRRLRALRFGASRAPAEAVAAVAAALPAGTRLHLDASASAAGRSTALLRPLLRQLVLLRGLEVAATPPPLVALLADALPIALPAPRRETTTARRPPSDDFVDALAPHLSPDADLGAGGEVGATEAEALRRGLRERGWASLPALAGAETASAAREEARELARQSALPRSLRSFAALRGPLWRAMEGATRADRHVEIWPQPTRLPALTEAMLALRRLVGHAAPDLPDGSSLTFQLATFAGDGGRLQYHRDDCDGGADGAEPTAEACAADAAAGNGTAECAQRAALCWYADASQYGPGRRPRRLLTALWYLNVGWRDGDGGELRLRAADGEVSLPPRGDEAVLFNASVPHDVAPSHAERWALTMWVHDAQ